MLPSWRIVVAHALIRAVIHAEDIHKSRLGVDRDCRLTAEANTPPIHPPLEVTLAGLGTVIVKVDLPREVCSHFARHGLVG